jgi:hypothetical protein
MSNNFLNLIEIYNFHLFPFYFIGSAQYLILV